jgi:hypothetical protein
MIFTFLTALLYPYCTAFGGISHDFKDNRFQLIFFGEVVMLFDIVFTFILAYQEEG